MAQDNSTQVSGTVSEDEAEKRFYALVTMSPEFKAALVAFAEKAEKPYAQVCREAIARTIGYDLSQEPETARRSKYETQEEREAAHKTASFKAALLRRLLVAQHNIRTGKVKADSAKVDALSMRHTAAKTREDLDAIARELDTLLGVKPKQAKS